MFRPAQNIPLGANPLVSTKIALTAPQTISLDKLIIHDGNVRRIEAGVSIENLAADSARTARASLRVLDQSVDTAISAGKAFWHACGVCPI